MTIEPFAEGSYSLSAKLKTEIEQMAKTIQKNHYTTVSLTGYTDNVFTAAFNATLNQNRAEAVSTQLTRDLQSLKVSGVAITVVPGFSIVLVSTNATAKGRAMNRRVVASLKVT